MNSLEPDFLQQLAQCCCPGISLTPAEDELPMLASGVKKSHRSRFLFSPKLTLWNTKFRERCYLFHVEELNFDTLAQCHTRALELGMAYFNPTAKHSHTQITAVILCNSVQADAMEALVSFKQRGGSLFSPKARLAYRLAAIDLSTEEISCNRRSRGLKTTLQAFLHNTHEA